MAVHPDYQRKGAGTLLLNWGTKIADQLDLPLYLEATMLGKQLYKRSGFEQVDSVIHKAEIIREAEDLEIPIMVKMPQSSKEAFREWQAGE